MKNYNSDSPYKIKLRPVSFELGPSRPPSEARSLLLRLTRGCPWHRCEFCSSHRTKKFELRSVKEIKRDIDAAKDIYDQIKNISQHIAFKNDITKAAAFIYDNSPTEGFRVVAQWIYFGEKSIFLQDADSLIMKTSDMVEVLTHIKKAFPQVERITSYGRLKTAAKKTLDEMKQIHAAGLVRLHVGLESGCDEILEYVKKGTNSKYHIRGGRNAVDSGVSLCTYIVPGLGGKRWTKEHACETARVLNEINPGYIRLRSLAIREDIPLYKKWASGEFELLSDDETVEEIKELIQKLDVTSYLASDHIENLLREVDGKLPEDKDKIINIIKSYQGLSYEKRLNFQLGQRSGIYTTLSDQNDPLLSKRVNRTFEMITAGSRDKEKDLLLHILQLKKGFLV